MVGCETLTTKTNGLPATPQSVLDKTASGPGTACASGTAPGQIGTCVCPGDGCQTFVCALRLPHAKTMQVTNNIFAVILFMVLDDAEIRHPPHETFDCKRDTMAGLSASASYQAWSSLQPLRMR